jgi:hypothetical protein
MELASNNAELGPAREHGCGMWKLNDVASITTAVPPVGGAAARCQHYNGCPARRRGWPRGGLQAGRAAAQKSEKGAMYQPGARSKNKQTVASIQARKQSKLPAVRCRPPVQAANRATPAVDVDVKDTSAFGSRNMDPLATLADSVEGPPVVSCPAPWVLSEREGTQEESCASCTGSLGAPRVLLKK